MGILLCEQNFLDVWIRNKSVRAEIGQILRTHTHAAKLVVEIGYIQVIPVQRQGLVMSLAVGTRIIQGQKAM